MKIIFLGTPEFAVASLDILVINRFNIVAVVTAPDKPAGRGKLLTKSEIKKYSEEKGLKILQPENLKDSGFIQELSALNADLFIVVAFRMLPESVWMMPSMGTFNLHASLLPQYRGAAPINRAIMNGEKRTGVTTFFLRKEIDTGNIIFREEIPIDENETAGELHDKLMTLGAGLVLKTANAIKTGSVSPMEQSHFVSENNELKSAPKIFKENCRINWQRTALEIFNHIRGLSPYPAAYTSFQSQGSLSPSIKIYRSAIEISPHNEIPGIIISDGKTFLKIAAKGGYIHLHELQLAGKKKMEIKEFLMGFKIGLFTLAISSN